MKTLNYKRYNVCLNNSGVHVSRLGGASWGGACRAVAGRAWVVAGIAEGVAGGRVEEEEGAGPRTGMGTGGDSTITGFPRKL